MKTAQCSRHDRFQLSTALADQRSRQLLSCLQDGPATVRDLAVALAASDLDCARSAVTATDRRQYHQQLDHRYLPRLNDVGLVTRSPDGFVEYVPTVLDGFEVEFPSLAEPTDPSWPAAAAVLGRAYRHSLVSLVAEVGSASLSQLTDQLAGADGTPGQRPRELAITLHHVDLPKLAAVGLLNYDYESRTATRTADTETVL
ncbi:DUF7344 domain-containing protein [Haloarcula onubensis]|uniref:DUF7344 domain-containing protein n=1 Tax=Haloarcula onubensis TaxID=2950539 RepID=A0ABU2FJK0_9EURY|nr:hypothetical protein [Halomicroarcula sp. S3CR25-11]MDS0280917.1 hypothetical protein [Halomicroarcula sp. S3CR25-11]